MQLNKSAVVILSIIFISSVVSVSVFAKIYTWTDEQGKVHYTDTPPSSDDVGIDPPKTSAPEGSSQGIEGTSPLHFQHRLFRVEEGQYLCGSVRLRYNLKDPRRSLISAYREAPRFERLKMEKKRLLADLSKDLRSKGARKNSRNERVKLESYKCAIKFYGAVKVEYNGYKERIFQEAHQAEARFKESDSACGLTPTYETHTQKEMNAWGTCKEKHRYERKRRLERYKETKNYEESLVEALEEKS